MKQQVALAPATRSHGLASTDVLIVGGGIIGCATAYYLAREGVDVVVIDQNDVNAEGSGSNAGSLHVMMISRFFRSTDPLWVRSREELLPLLLNAIATWQDLAGELGRDIDLKQSGGLMVAETREQLEVLERKAEVELRHGLDVDILTGSDLRRVAPYLSPAIIGAERCANEGKVNPILATPALAEGARQGGARILRATELIALNATGKGYEAHTSAGVIAAKRVVNAAGASAGKIGAMAAICLPIRRFPRHMNVTEAGPALFAPLLQHAGRLLTLKQASNGTILIGGGWPSEADETKRRLRIKRTSIEGNLGVARSVVPGVGRLRLLRTWPGVIVLTPDGNGILGEVPSHPGLFNAVPPNMGYTASPLCARLLTEIMLGKSPSFDISSLAIDRFTVHGARPEGQD